MFQLGSKLDSLSLPDYITPVNPGRRESLATCCFALLRFGHTKQLGTRLKVSFTGQSGEVSSLSEMSNSNSEFQSFHSLLEFRNNNIDKRQDVGIIFYKITKFLNIVSRSPRDFFVCSFDR